MNEQSPSSEMRKRFLRLAVRECGPLRKASDENRVISPHEIGVIQDCLATAFEKVYYGFEPELEKASNP